MAVNGHYLLPNEDRNPGAEPGLELAEEVGSLNRASRAVRCVEPIDSGARVVVPDEKNRLRRPLDATVREIDEALEIPTPLSQHDRGCIYVLHLTESFRRIANDRTNEVSLIRH